MFPNENNKIYVMYCKGAVKVGKSWCPSKRLRGLQTGCPSKIKLLYAAEFDAPVGPLEKTIHQIMRPLNMRGEWFDVVDPSDIPDMIEAVAKYTHGMKVVASKRDNDALYAGGLESPVSYYENGYAWSPVNNSKDFVGIRVRPNTQ